MERTTATVVALLVFSAPAAAQESVAGALPPSAHDSLTGLYELKDGRRLELFDVIDQTRSPQLVALEPGSGQQFDSTQSDTAAVFQAMDSVYDRFQRAYRMGAPDSVVVLYTDDPLYLPGRGEIRQGSQQLRAQFDFLRTIAAQRSTAHITFVRVDRGTSGDLAYDVGYYNLEVESANGERTPSSRGKFTTIWKRDGAGRWRIHVDSFSPAGSP